MTGLAETYVDTALAEVSALQGQLGQIQAAGLVADSWGRGGVLWVGQVNHILDVELVGRAAGPVAAAVLDHGGDGELISRYYDLGGLGGRDPQLIGVRPGDVLLMHMNIGHGRQIQQVVELAHERGVPVIALSQVVQARSGAIPAGTTDGRFLCDYADVTVDLGGSVGDGTLELEGSDVRICPTSGVTGVAAAWAILAHAAELAAESGQQPLFLASDALPGAARHNASARQAWSARRG